MRYPDNNLMSCSQPVAFRVRYSACRLASPIGGEDSIFGRDGLLAHTHMLGGTGQSNGCVSFKDYYAFLDAYKNKGIRKIAVIAKVD